LYVACNQLVIFLSAGKLAVDKSLGQISFLVERIKMDKNERSHNLRHSAAHLLAHAITHLFPGTKTTIGPVTDVGFFYDFLPLRNFKDEDLPLIEAKMHEIANQGHKIIGKQVTREEALRLFAENQFKKELIEGITDETVGIFTQGDFFDLCKGGHVDTVSKIKYFKLTGISGSYWRADREGIALQRISGIAFETQEELDQYLKRQEELKMYDHRVLGTQLDLYSFHEEASGMPFYHAKGLTIFNGLINHLRNLQKKEGYKELKTPLILGEDLWRTSGHYDNFKNSMFFTSAEEVSYCVKPMNCPCHILVYKEKPHSYREFPLRLSEFGFVHRYELSGVMHGLFRVRAFTQDDAHVFCTPEQVQQEIINILDLTQRLYAPFNFTKVTYAVSTRPENYIGSVDLWDKATDALKDALTAHKIPFKIQEGEGAFYGPKIEIKIEDAMGREWQCGTVQVDFFMPNNFGLEYIDSDQSRKTPVMLHRALYGSLDRFIGVLTEHCKGHFPFWLTPVQARVLTISEKQMDYAKQIFERLQDADLRVELDESGDQISAQIRRAQVEKIPWMVVIGQKEVDNQTVTLRHVDGKQEFGLSIDSLLRKAEEARKI